MSAPYVVAQLGVACCGVLVKVQQIPPISTKLRHENRKKQYHVALKKYDGKWLRWWCWMVCVGGGRNGREMQIQLESECTINYFISPIQFPLPFVCWFVKSPVSVSKDKTKSASSSESGSDDVGSCSVSAIKKGGETKGGSEKVFAKGKYDWNINDAGQRVDKGLIGLSDIFLAYLGLAFV